MEENIVGENILYLRKSRKMTQEQLGRVLGYSARTVSDWEKGHTEPNIAAIKAIVKFFEISYNDLLER